MFYKGRSSCLDLGGGQVFLPELVTQEKKVKAGKVIEISVSMVSQSKTLPDLLDVTLSQMIEAGTPLKSVSPIMFQATSVSSDILGDDVFDDKSDDKSDVNSVEKEKSNEE